MNADAEMMFMFILGHVFYFIVFPIILVFYARFMDFFLIYVGEVKNGMAEGLFMYVLKIWKMYSNSNINLSNT